MKKHNVMSIIFIALGSCILSYPFIASGYSKYQQKELQKEYEKVLEEAIENQKKNALNQNIDAEAQMNDIVSKEVVKSDMDSSDVLNGNLDSTNSNFDSSQNSDVNSSLNISNDLDSDVIDDVEENTELKVDMNAILPQLEQASKDSQGSLEKSKDVDDFLSRQQILGMIEIEKIDLKMIIVEGTDWDNIRVTIGHMTQTAAIGDDGNCALAGHRGGTYGTFFKHIDQLENDDEIKLTDLNGKVFTYIVYDKFITEPTDMSVIEPIQGEKTLTLISCENSGKTRIIVHARLL
ncbi:MAG: sortase family protein [Anaerocolumna sp.]|nr:sortase family protein [Anaerocolumna sp.]